MKSIMGKIRSKKALFFLAVVLSAICFTSSAFAAAWTPPTNVRIVQKSDIDNRRVFPTITQALNSITDASATNPYLIKVMPGIYDLAGAQLQMKEYVAIVGSGQESTKLVNANITGAGNSVLSDLAIDITNGIGISETQSTMTMHNLDITATNSLSAITATNANLDIDNIKVTTFAGGVWAITFSNNNSGSTSNKVSIRNSTITVNNGNVGVADLYASGAVEIDSTRITINSGADFGYGVFRVKSTSNSKIIVNSSQQYSAAFETFGPTKIYNTYVEAATPFFNYTGGSPMCANVYDANLARICP